MNKTHQPISKSARIVAILWLVLLTTFWFIEGGFRPWLPAFEGLTERAWWSGDTIRQVETDFEDNLAGLKEVRPYYNWATFWAFGQSDGLVIRGKDGFMFYRAMMNDIDHQSRSIDDYITLFRQLKLAYQKAGCDIYWLPVPEKPMVYPHNLYGAQNEVAKRKAQLQAFVSKIEKMQFKVLDLPSVFFEHADSEPLLFLPDDTHWNDAGKNLAVDLISERLRRDKALMGSKPVIKAYTTRRLSDLPRLVNFPMTLRRRFHSHEVEKFVVQGTGPADFIHFGTSFSHGFDLAEATGARFGAMPEDHSINSITIPDLLMTAITRLEAPHPISPGTPVIIEFPFRLLLRDDGLKDIQQQFQWRQSPAFKPTQITLDPSSLKSANITPGKVWTCQNEDPMFFITEDTLTKADQPNFIVLRMKFDKRPPSHTSCTVFYDMGDGFKKSINHRVILNVSESWQTWLLPVRYKRKMARAIRLDPVNRKLAFRLGPITIH